jgi:hypothetical protein
MDWIRRTSFRCDILSQMSEAKEKPKSHRVSTSDDIEVSTYLGIAKEIQGEQTAPKLGELPQGTKEAIAIIDFGSQYSRLIARRVRECNVYCELFHWETPLSKIMAIHPRGFILSGGPASVYEKGAPLAPVGIYESHLPVLATACKPYHTSWAARLRLEPGVNMGRLSYTQVKIILRSSTGLRIRSRSG